MNNIKQCKTDKEVDILINFFESVFLETQDLESVKKTSSFKGKLLLDNINKKNNFIYYIEVNNKIIAGLYSYRINEKLYLDVLAVQKEYRRMGLSKHLITYIIEKCKSIKEIIVFPNKSDKNKSFSYYIHNCFKPILCLSCFEDVDFRKYNKYNLNSYEVKKETFIVNGETKYHSTIKYYIDNPDKKYYKHYEEAIPNIEWYYMFVKKIE